VNYRKLTLVMLSLFLVIALAAGCGPTPAAPAEPADEEEPPAEEPEVIKIGFVNHLTGDAAVYGTSMKKGAEVALAEINNMGGIDGKRIEVVFEDDRLNPTDAISAVRKLLEVDKVPVVIGSSSSTITLSILPLVQELGAILMNSVSTAPSLRDYSGTYFGLMPTDEAQGLEWVNFARDIEEMSAAVMYINNDYGIGVKEAFAKEFAAAGGNLLIAEPHDVGKADFRTELLKVKAKDPKLVFIVSHVKEGSIVFKQARELGMEVQWVGDVALESKEVIDLAGPAAEGLICLRVGSKQTQEYEQFAEAFRSLHNEEPTIWSDFAYDTMWLAAKAVAEVGTDPQAIRDYLWNVKEYPGASGKKTFDEDGIAAGVYERYVVKNGEFVLWQP
jgi:ABC-type branched-subunit amino acid transport system substrate-binding protein